VFAPQQLTAIGDAPIAAIATSAFLEASGRTVGDTMPLAIGGIPRTVEIVGGMSAVPTVDADEPALVVDLPTLALIRYEGTDSTDPPGEWWFALDPAQAESAVDALSQQPIASRTVVTADERARALATDPVALGIIGALAIGFVAAALFAVVGFVVSAAVSARERIGEFALLRALGLSAGQLSGWLSLENAVLATVSLAAGTVIGLAMAWVVLPFVTVTQSGAAPFPPVTLAVPWPAIAILEAVALVALVTTIAVIAWVLRRIGLASVLRIGED
jgi:hypothetical protein